MGTITTFDHTADVGLRIVGDDLDDLFRTAAEGVMDYIVVNRHEVLSTDVVHISLQADDLAELLVAWLDELIYQVETTHRLFSRFEVTVSHLELQGFFAGEPIDRQRHILDHEVKAVTRHGLSVVEKDGKWIAEMILDI